MRNFCLVLLAALAMLTWGCAAGEGYSRAEYDFQSVEKIAIIDVEGSVGGEAAKNQIGDFFAMELLKKGYAPVERAQVKNLLKEQEFQGSDITTMEGAVQAGRILNVPSVLIINVPTFNDEISMTAKMLDVEDGSILWIGSGEGSTGKTLGTIAGAAAGVVGGVMAGGDDNEVIGGVAGGVLGGVAGQALTPQKAAIARDIAKKICKTLPSRLK